MLPAPTEATMAPHPTLNLYGNEKDDSVYLISLSKASIQHEHKEIVSYIERLWKKERKKSGERIPLVPVRTCWGGLPHAITAQEGWGGIENSLARTASKQISADTLL